MTSADLLAALDAREVQLAARLVVDAPAGALTPELREALTAHKPLLLQRVVRGMVWAELSRMRWEGADEAPGIDNPGRRPSLDMPAMALQADVDAADGDTWTSYRAEIDQLQAGGLTRADALRHAYARRFKTDPGRIDPAPLAWLWEGLAG
jgi:hypothetical protein